MISPVVRTVNSEIFAFSLLFTAFNIRAAAVALSETAVIRADADSTLATI